MEANICQRITDQIVREFEDGVRPWIKPWNAGNGSGRIRRPLRAKAARIKLPMFSCCGRKL
ncbi:protein of unknown function [Bradyrhizobium sp. Rc2d]|nr:protein of unknown function [Bradyrhizobium sp. Rc2d]